MQLGAALAQEQQRLAAEEHRTQMEAQARQENLQRETQMQQARLATETAYHTAELGLQKSRLEETARATAARTQQAGAVLAQRKAEADAKAQDAAARMADQQGFATDLAGGMPVDKALFRHPRLTTPAAAVAASKAMGGSKDYGPVTKEEIAPGVLAVYRAGSPGVHIVNPRRKEGELTPAQRTTLATKIPALMQQSQFLDPGTPEHAFTTNLVDSIMQMTKPKAPDGDTPAATTEPARRAAPKPGEVYKGYRFQGGNPADKANWMKVDDTGNREGAGE
jgi:hypothetical protein